MKNNQKGFTLSELSRVLCILAVIALVAFSSDSKAEGFTILGGDSNFSVATGPDIHKITGKMYAEFRYRETLYNFKEGGYWGTESTIGYSLYAGTMVTFGGDLFLTHNKWMFGFGIEGAEADKEIVDSVGGYELLVEYAFTEQWAVSLKHRSNCRQICRHLKFMPKGSESKRNGGFNFLMIRYSW